MKNLLILSLTSLLIVLSTFIVQANEVEETLSTDNYKYQVAKKVFDKLVRAKGDKRLRSPDFTMGTKKRYVAWMNGKKGQIGIEEAAYDICVQYGEDSLNAIAALLGHEIIHYYEKHSWGNEFATAFSDLNVSSTVKNNARSQDLKAMNETEADYQGGFLAYSAGYKTFGIMPKVLVDVYTTYDLPREIPGYPSLDDRTKLAVESEMRLEDLISVFETANYMIVLQQYESVDQYFAYILKEYQSREIFNNAGVNAVMAALQLFDEGAEELKYAYPLQLDGQTRMQRPKTRGDNYGFAERKAKREELLKKAQFYFEQAKALDKDYGTALINLACVSDLIGEYEEASFYAKKAGKIAKKSKNSKVEADAYIIRGIATIHEGEPEDGKSFLERAKTKDEGAVPLANLNLTILAGNTPEPTKTKPKLSLTKEKLDNIDLDQFISSIDVDNLLEINGDLSCGIKDLDNSKILLNLVGGGQKGYTLLHLTKNGYADTTGDGMKIGSPKTDVVQKYGTPSYIQEARQGQYLVYDFKNIAFFINDNKVDSWCLYRVKAEE